MRPTSTTIRQLPATLLLALISLLALTAAAPLPPPAPTCRCFALTVTNTLQPALPTIPSFWTTRPVDPCTRLERQLEHLDLAPTTDGDADGEGGRGTRSWLGPRGAGSGGLDAEMPVPTSVLMEVAGAEERRGRESIVCRIVGPPSRSEREREREGEGQAAGFETAEVLFVLQVIVALVVLACVAEVVEEVMYRAETWWRSRKSVRLEGGEKALCAVPIVVVETPVEDEPWSKADGQDIRDDWC